MIKLEECEGLPPSAPTIDKVKKSKSKKVFRLKDLYFFMTVQEEKSNYPIVSIYSIDLGIKVITTVNGKNNALILLNKHFNELERIVNETKSIHHNK